MCFVPCAPILGIERLTYRYRHFSLKANSTNTLIFTCTFYTSLGITLGSVGHYLGQFETLENIVAYKTLHAGYIRT